MSTAVITVDVALGERSYPVHVGPGLLAGAARLGESLDRGRVLVVTDTNVAPLYLERVRESLGGRGDNALVLEAGEAHKTLATAERVIDELVARKCHRDATVLALGGGVVGDVAGFAAACFMRGIGFVPLPTTLLAQVDASVGGKTGVNHRAGKNLIGAFHQPRAVLADTSTLATLPDREYRAGLAEVVKYGVIGDADFFRWLEGRAGELNARDEATLTETIARCVRNKAAVVAADEREKGQRALLNLGHTFGHALESLTGYQRWLHGEAVAIGMVQAARLAARTGLCNEDVAHRVADLLARLGLDTGAPVDLGAEALLEAMEMDKKADAGGLRLVLPEAVGQCRVVRDVPRADLLAVLAGDR